MIQSRQPVVYRIDAIRRWTLGGGAALICSIPFVAAVDPANGYQLLPAMLASAVTAPIALAFVWICYRPRLALSTQGLSVSRLGFSIQVPWAEIERINLESSVQGVVLKQPSEAVAIQRERGLATRSSLAASNYSAQQLQLIQELRFIDLRGFVRQLRSAEFAHAVAPYAVLVTGSSAGS